MLKCLIYLAVTGLISFFVGRFLPKNRFRFDRFPFRPFPFEKNGDIYLKVGVKKWKEKVPDMSRILPFLMPSKKLPRMADASQLCQMLQETCIAELVHALLCVAGVGAVFIWRGIGGWLFFILYAFGNLPFIIIQRYNRPKLMRLLQLVGDREKNKIR